jgi:hypothetical protein
MTNDSVFPGEYTRQYTPQHRRNTRLAERIRGHIEPSPIGSRRWAVPAWLGSLLG